MIKVAVCGACGRMGNRIIKTVNDQDDMQIVAAIDEPNTPKAGKDAGKVSGIGSIGVEVKGSEKIRDTLEDTQPDVMVDFTVASAAVQNVKTSAELGIPVVVGTTGFSTEQRGLMDQSIEENDISAVISPNMSVGVNVFFKLIEEAAEKLEDYDMELVEAHHNKKVDAPSGTALNAAKIASDASDKDFDKVARFGREKGNLGERPKDEIGIHSIRAGNIAGDHNFIFAGPSERLEIKHKAQSRQAFADGVIKAVRHVREQGKPGETEDMLDILFGPSQ